MNNEVATLQNIANTLEQEPLANGYNETLCKYISEAKKREKQDFVSMVRATSAFFWCIAARF